MSNPYRPARTQRSRNRAKQWDLGRQARLGGLPCSSANGAWLEGWYSIEPPKIVAPLPLKSVSIKWDANDRRFKVIVANEVLHSASRKDKAVSLAIPYLIKNQMLTYIGCKPLKKDIEAR